jgi:hypothetical protein
MVGWWLAHAWRLADLVEATVNDLQEWRITVAAVGARAALEEAGCLLHEARALTAAWADAKNQDPKAPPYDRAVAVRSSLRPALTKVTLSSRMGWLKEATEQHPELRATNVMTYIQKLAKAVQKPEAEDWYDWLSDAAHPALGARLAYASDPAVHESNAVALATLARRPVPLRNIDGTEWGARNAIAPTATDALLLAAEVGEALLAHGLRLVDDIGLTTGAATLTLHPYWRALRPVRGSRACPCGRGRWSACESRVLGLAQGPRSPASR